MPLIVFIGSSVFFFLKPAALPQEIKTGAYCFLALFLDASTILSLVV
jgi:hypothetical protein